MKNKNINKKILTLIICLLSLSFTKNKTITGTINNYKYYLNSPNLHKLNIPKDMYLIINNKNQYSHFNKWNKYYIGKELNIYPPQLISKSNIEKNKF